MAETSKNKIYYNDDENSVADVPTDMKKMAESTDKAIENSKYNDAQIKKDISDAKKEQALKDAEQDNKIIELQNEKTELEKELKEAQEDFYQNSIRGQASGEYIHVEDSSNCRGKIGISGNHEQETRSGKNKIEITKTTTTVNGCTHTIKNGTDILSGTSSSNWANLIIYSFVGDGKTYTLSGSPSTSKNIFISAHDNVQKKDLATSKNGSTGTFVATSGNSIDIIICVAPNLTLANELFKPQLEEGLKATVWEQGGASPSPDYPSKIEVVGSNVNEFDIAAVKDGFLNEKTGEIISNNSWKCSDFIEILNKTYTFGWESSSDYFQVTVCYYDENKKFISGKSYGLRGTFNNTFEIVSNAKYMKIAYSVSVRGESVTREKIKLEKGTVATPWSQHGQGCVKVTKCNKNLFDKDKALQKYELNRTTGQIKSNDLFFTSDYIRVSPNKQYFLSGKNDGESNCFYDKNKKYIDAVVLKNGLLTVPDNSNIYYLRLNSRLTAIDTTMLEKNTKKSAYEEHQEQSYIISTQQPMRSVGNIRDTFIKTNGKWYERHYIARKIFDGTEGWMLIDNNIRFAIKITEQRAKIDVRNSSSNLTECLSNRFVKAAQAGVGKVNNRIAFSEWSGIQFLYLSKIKDSVAELKSYLAENETYVDYPLEIPLDLECTEEQSKILDELNNARTYKNVTNITTDSKAILSLDYAKDLETQNQKMQNEIDEIKQLLSTTQTSALLLDNMQNDIESEVE